MKVSKSKQPALPRPSSPTPGLSSPSQHNSTQERAPLVTEHSYLLAPRPDSPSGSSDRIHTRTTRLDCKRIAPREPTAAMAPSQLFELPRPKVGRANDTQKYPPSNNMAQNFFQTMSLRTGAEIITYLQVINKVSGLYGLLALLTGASIDGWQLSMYLYSTVVLVATVYLYKHIRLQTTFETLCLAHLYALDSVVNALYTAFFGFIWFYTLANHPDGKDNSVAPGIADNAGFTSPKFNVSEVNVVAEPAGVAGQNAVAVGQGTPGSAPGLGGAVFQTSSIMSISLIAGFWALRVYFVFVMLAFARQCLRQYIAANASSTAWYNNDTPTLGNLAENPFQEGKEAGYGWKGKAGRTMLSGAPQYWLGSSADEDESWMRGVGGKFIRKSVQVGEPIGLGERERRRRSGTGPPAPPKEMRTPQLADLPEAR